MTARISQDGWSVHLDTMQVRRGDAFRSHMAAGLWLGVVAQGQLETEEALFGRRRWNGPSATAFWAPQPMHSDHFILADGPMSAVFVHIEPGALAKFGVSESQMASTELMLSGDGPRLRRLQAEAAHLLGSTGAAVAEPELLAAARRVTSELLQEAGVFAAPEETSLPAPELNRLYLARDLLLADLRNPPSVVQLARRTGTNARKLTEEFRALFGLPPFAYLKRCRLDYALEALRRGDRPIGAIAADVGYRPAHLSAVFRQRFGRAPRSYRDDVAER